MVLPQITYKQGLNLCTISITVSAQLLVLADRLGFGKICSGEIADKRYRHFTARPQLYAMMIAQLAGQKGLRTIEETIASDYDLDCADYLFITNANRHENSTLGQMWLTEDDIAVFDRGYFNKRQFLELTESSISFVTRNKSNIEHEVISSDKRKKSDDSFKIRRDEIISMRIGQSKKNPIYVTLRQVVTRDNVTGKEISLLTNMFGTDPLEIAAIYKKRWEVELFFKMIKQNLRVKRFYGQSENAVKT